MHGAVSNRARCGREPAARAILALLALLASGALAAQQNPSFESDATRAGVPAGWDVSGRGYELRVDDGVSTDGRRSLSVHIESADGYLRLTQHIAPRSSAGDRLRLSASLRRSSAAASSRAGLRLRLDDASGLLYVDSVRTDEAPVAVGASSPGVPGAWRRYTVEAPKFPQATSIELGATFEGPGTYWVDGFTLRDVDTAGFPPASVIARRYLDAALDLMQEHSIRSAAVDWRALRAAALRQLRGAETQADAHLAVGYAIALLGDHHSYLLSPVRSAELEAEPVSNARTGRAVIEPRGTARPDGLAYLFVPGFAGGRPEAQVAFAERLQDLIRGLDEAARCGWIVDLRDNSGGNVWPMLLGLGPLIGEGEAAAALYPDGRRVPLWYRNGRAGLGDYVQLRVTAPYRSLREDPYVALLLGERTASSGEIVAAAFHGPSRHRTFGAATSGLAQGNRNFSLSDGATLVLTVAATSDRTGKVLSGPIEPDEATPEPTAIDTAARWLKERCEPPDGSRRSLD